MNKDKKSNFYLKNIKLSGYKSVVNLDVNLVKGLNIIIGKNAAGKTNFLTFLNKILEYNYDNLNNFYSKLAFVGAKDIELEASSQLEEFSDGNEINKIQKQEVKTVLKIDGSRINDDKSSDFVFNLSSQDIAISTTFVRHGVPIEYDLVDKSFSFNVEKDGFPSGLINKIFDSETPFFIKSIMAEFVFALYPPKNATEELMSVEKITRDFTSAFDKLEGLKKVLEQFSPIKDIRFNKNFNVFVEENDSYTFNNVFIEFNIMGAWHPYSNLSDGTKRLFYIISEIGNDKGYYFTKQSFGVDKKFLSRLVIIEEPELGVHPHQLMSLMKFIKEKSRDLQIIVSTHSPITLDILNKEELENILIASSTEKSTGTKLRHLSTKEVEKATAYMKEDYLSDYWKHSNLEI